MEKIKSKARKEKQLGMTQSFMVAQLGGIEAFERAKKAGEIKAVEDESTGEVYWAHKTLEIESKEVVTHGSRAAGKHALQADEFHSMQAC